MPIPGSELHHLARLDSGQLEFALLGAVDLVLMLDCDRRVTEVHVGPEMNLPGAAGWMGCDLNTLVCLASRTKLAGLFTQDPRQPGAPRRWRHLNFLDATGSFPFLINYFGFDGAGGGRHVILGRDLRPTVALQAKVQKALTELEQASEALVATSAQDLRLGDAVAGIGQRPMQQIVSEMARTLERLCLEEALRRANGDTAIAAELLGLPQKDVMQRLRMI